MPVSDIYQSPTLTPLDLKQLSRKDKLELLQRYKTTKARCPNTVFFIATDLLSAGPGGFSTQELYDVYEQVVIASLECGKLENARMYLHLLEKKFGRRSHRVQHLKGLCLEAEGSVAEARALYEQILKESPTNGFVVMRLSAIHKAAGRYAEAVRVLQDDRVFTDPDAEEETRHRYLEVHRGDSADVYRELSHLHYLLNDTAKAAYYAEEELLFHNNSYFLHNRLGELFFRSRDYRRSVVEFSQSLLLNKNPNNLRAVYGLRAAAAEMLRLHQSGRQKLESEKEVTEAQDLVQYATELLGTMYKGSPLLSILDAFEAPSKE